MWFWLLYVILFIAAVALSWPFAPDTRRTAGVSLIILILIGLLGWGIFGPPLK